MEHAEFARGCDFEHDSLISRDAIDDAATNCGPIEVAVACLNQGSNRICTRRGTRRAKRREIEQRQELFQRCDPKNCAGIARGEFCGSVEVAIGSLY